MADTPTTAQIAQNYSAMGDSVTLLNAGKPSHMTEDQWTATKKRNVEHLELMVAKDYWTDEDMSAVNKAIADFK